MTLFCQYYECVVRKRDKRQKIGCELGEHNDLAEASPLFASGNQPRVAVLTHLRQWPWMVAPWGWLATHLAMWRSYLVLLQQPTNGYQERFLELFRHAA